MNLDDEIRDFFTFKPQSTTPIQESLPKLKTPTFEEELLESINENCYVLFDRPVEKEKVILLRKKIIDKYIKKDIKMNKNLFKVSLDFPKRDLLLEFREECIKNVESLLDIIKKKGLFRLLLKTLIFHRFCVLSLIGNIEYETVYIPKFINSVKTILQKKKMNDIEITIILDELLTSYEKKSIFYGNYNLCEYNDFEKYLYCTAIDIYYSNISSFDSKSLLSYELCMFPIYQSIYLRIKGKYAYFKKFNNSSSDSWPYYYLYKVEDNKKYWKLDSRLDKLVISLEFVCNYCAKLFCKIYSAIYGNNNKRKIPKELKILYDNISILSNRKGCSIILRENLEKLLKQKINLSDIIDRIEDDITVIDDYDIITNEDIEKEKNKVLNGLFSFV